MQPRRIARELALLSFSQLPQTADRLPKQDLQQVIVAAVRTLRGEVNDALETAAAELKRSNDRLLTSETRAADLDSARAMVTEAIDLAQSAVNRMGQAIELPEFLQLSNQQEVRDYTLRVLSHMQHHRQEIDELLERSLVDWQLHRLAQIDRNILRIAITEFRYLEIPHQVAINEAVELAKRYSSEDSHRFINGVLRRVVEFSTHPKAETKNVDEYDSPV